MHDTSIPTPPISFRGSNCARRERLDLGVSYDLSPVPLSPPPFIATMFFRRLFFAPASADKDDDRKTCFRDTPHQCPEFSTQSAEADSCMGEGSCG